VTVGRQTEDDTIGRPVLPPAQRVTMGRFAVAVLAMCGLGASFMQTLVVPIQAQLPDLLDAPRDHTAWVITVTLVVAAVVNPVAGRLGDMYGKRRVVLVLLGTLVVGSVLCALSTGLGWLIVGRGLQGASLGTIALGIAILRDHLPKDRLPGAIALVSATLGVGGAIGLPISAVISEHADWHVLFWAAAALGALTFVLIVIAVPATRVATAAKFDTLGAVGLAIGLTAVLLAVSQAQSWGPLSGRTLVCAIGGVAVLLVWGWYQLRRDQPMVDLRVAARRPVLMTNLASIASGFALFSGQVAFPQLLELPTSSGVGLELSLLAASFILMPAGLVMMAMSPLSGRLIKLFGPRLVLATGCGIVALGYVVALVLPISVTSIAVVNLLMGLGIGVSYASIPTLIMRSVPASETAAANGLNSLMRMLGTSTAAAVVGALLAGMSRSVGGEELPTAGAFHAAFVIGAVVALVGSGLALLVPRASEREPAPSADGQPVLDERPAPRPALGQPATTA
jgi:MFS family permease